MIRYATFLALLLTAAAAHAVGFPWPIAGEDLYLRFKPSNVEVALVESDDAAWYEATSFSGVSDGVYSAIVLRGAPGDDSTDVVGTVPSIAIKSGTEVDRLGAVQAITDSFDNLPDDAQNPVAAGSPAIAQAALAGKYDNILVIGDSVAENTQQAWTLMLERFGVRGFTNAAPWSSAGSGALLKTNNFTDFDRAGGWWGEINYSGGTSDASDTSDANVLLSIAKFGPTAAQNDSADNHSTEHRWSFGEDWMAAILPTGELRFRFPVKQGPSGTTAANEYFAIRNGTTRIGQSDYFSTYHPTPRTIYVTAAVAQGTSTPLANLNLQLRFRASTAKETGKETVASARIVVDNPAAESGSIITVCAQGGLAVDGWASTGSVSNEAISYWGLLRPQLAIIGLGLNNPLANSAATHATKLQEVAARVRSHSPHAAICYWGLFGRATENPDFGGGGPEPYHVEGAYLAQQATANSIFINSCQMLPRAGILAGPSYSAFWAWSFLPEGQLFHKGMAAYFGANYYYAKLTHARGNTTGDYPPNNTTNWGLIGAIEDGTGDHDDQRRPKFTDANVMFYDQLHPHLAGGRLLVQTLVDGLYIIRYSTGQGLIAQGVRQELSEELARIDVPISDIEASVDLQPVLDAVADSTTEATAAKTAAVAVQGKLPAGGRNMFGAGALVTNGDQIEAGEGGTGQPRVNRPPAERFTFDVSSRSDGTYKARGKLRLLPTEVSAGNIAFGLRMNDLYGDVLVANVGEAVIAGGLPDFIATSLGPHSTIAMLRAGGTVQPGAIGTITVPITMDTGGGGETVLVILDVEIGTP